MWHFATLGYFLFDLIFLVPLIRVYQHCRHLEFGNFTALVINFPMLFVHVLVFIYAVCHMSMEKYSLVSTQAYKQTIAVYGSTFVVA